MLNRRPREEEGKRGGREREEKGKQKGEEGKRGGGGGIGRREGLFSRNGSPNGSFASLGEGNKNNNSRNKSRTRKPKTLYGGVNNPLSMDLIVPRLPSPPPTPAPPEASLTTQERLRLARRRRAAQLKRWTQRERERNHPPPDLVAGGAYAGLPHRGSRNISFVPDVMLLESAARNDVAEGRGEAVGS